jgi:hypothetical protein
VGEEDEYCSRMRIGFMWHRERKGDGAVAGVVMNCSVS